MATVQLRDPQTGEIFDVDESEAEQAARVNRLEPASAEQVKKFDADLAYEKVPLGEKALDTAQAGLQGSPADQAHRRTRR